MQLRFTTSFVDGPLSYMEGQTIDVRQPTPKHLEWLRLGMAEAVKTREVEVALLPSAVEQTVARRRAARAKGGKTRASMPLEADMRGVPILCPGGTVVCIGGGPSLTQADVDVCRGKATVIAINDAYRLAPWADVLYACDAKWWGWHPEAAAHRGLKFGLGIAGATFPEGVVALERTGDLGLEINPTGVRTGRNSGFQAINVAVHLGATRVLLVGYDMQPSSSGKSHWFGEHRDGVRPPLESFIPQFASLLHPLQQLGVEVLNCTPGSALQCFPAMDLRTALSQRRKAVA